MRGMEAALLPLEAPPAGSGLGGGGGARVGIRVFCFFIVVISFSNPGYPYEHYSISGNVQLMYNLNFSHAPVSILSSFPPHVSFALLA